MAIIDNPQLVAYVKHRSAKVIDGGIVVMAVLGSLSYSLPSHLAVILTVGVSLLAIALAHTYAEAVNEELRTSRITRWRERWGIFAEQSWLMSSTLVPVFFFGLALFGIISNAIAFRLTEVALAGMIFFFAYLGRRLSGGSILQASVYGSGAVLVGLLVIEIKQWSKYMLDIG